MERVGLNNKVFTENPLLDEIIYNTRQIIYGGIVIKDSDLADNCETLESVKNGDLLVNINNGNIHFSNFHYDTDILSKYYTNTSDIYKYADNNNLIPPEDHKPLLTIAVNQFINTYVEYNNYYRRLHGEPSYDSKNKYLGIIIDTRAIDINIPTTSDNLYLYMPTVPDDEKQYYKPIHTLDMNLKNILYESGTCYNITQDSNLLENWGIVKDDVLYLLHIGDREIDYASARIANKFELLYCPPCSSEEVKNRFKEVYEANRLYLLYTMYSEAYKHRSYYYDNFMMIFLTIQTVIDLIIELPEYIIRRDVFDTRTCKYIFESNGVKYFDDIPLKYQIALVKNLNKLIKFKSTDKCIVDIISIFGINNIEVFKYYIMKDRYLNKPNDLDYYNNKKEEHDYFGNTNQVENNDTNYDLKFIKVPLLKPYDDYIRSDTNIYTYDSLTEDDRYWIGDKERDVVKKDIKNLDFTILRSKYYSIEAVIDLTKRNFMMTYFMNILMYNNVDKSALLVNLPNISNVKKFDIVNIIITLFSLSYIYYGVEDVILDSRAKAAQILGFNFEADLSKISNWLHENHLGLTLKDLHVDTFKTTNGKITSFNELEDIFFTNKDCYDHVVSLLNNPPSKEIYDAYKFIYKSMMTMNRNMECFLLDNDIINQYKNNGYSTKFINIPRKNLYHNPKDYDRDYKWLLESIDDNMLCLDMSDDFDENHLFDMYIKENSQLIHIGTAQMAHTYMEYLSKKDSVLYSYLSKIKLISDIDSRQETCINEIQYIISYLKDYIDQFGDDGIPLDTIFSGLPSISMDFIKRYITEVIDFFKSFKIFTHGSSIVYVISEKFENYIQLIEHILIKYLFDKSELVKIEDAIGGKIEFKNGRYLYSGNGIDTDISFDERNALIDKVWLDISTWVYKNYPEYYNSTNYNQIDKVMRDYHERYSTFTMKDTMLSERYIDECQCIAIDAIVKMIVSMILTDHISIDELVKFKLHMTYQERIDEWIINFIKLLVSVSYKDNIVIEDDISSFSTMNPNTINRIVDIFGDRSISTTKIDKFTIHDDLHKIITQSETPHSFDND